MIIWRIGTQTRDYKADDLSGVSSARSPGRWNKEGERVVYAATSVALTFLETAAYLGAEDLPMDRFLIAITVPDDVFRNAEDVDPDTAPPTIFGIPAGHDSVAIGSKWLCDCSNAILKVPSVHLPKWAMKLDKPEYNVLINPNHADAERITASVVEAFRYGSLFRR